MYQRESADEANSTNAKNGDHEHFSGEEQDVDDDVAEKNAAVKKKQGGVFLVGGSGHSAEDDLSTKDGLDTNEDDEDADNCNCLGGKWLE